MRTKIYSTAIILYSLLLLSACGGGSNPSDPDSLNESEMAAFGFGGIKRDGRAALGTRPVLLILENDSRFSPNSHGIAYYDGLFFGPGDKTLVDYFSEMSNGLFTWNRAGVIGPVNFTMPADIIADWAFVDNDDAATQAKTRARGDQKNVSRILQEAIDAGFDFTPFDTNNDNVIWNSELVIASAGNDDSQGGSLRSGLPVCPTQTRVGLPDLEICTSVILLGEHVGIATIGHELAHSIGRGMDELYGSAGLSQNYTLMGATIIGGDDDRQVFHLDPHYKMRLGWVQPRVSNLIQPDPGGEGRFGSCTQIAPTQSYLGGVGAKTPMILYDVLRGKNEYLMLEYRDPAMGGYDADAPYRGLGVWYVKTKADLSLQRITPGLSGCCDDATNFLLFPPDGARGSGGRLWNNSDGLFTLDWTVDGMPTNVYFGVSPQPLPNSIFEVEWATGGPLIPRADEGQSDASMVHGTIVSISGVFGVEDFGVRTVGLVSTGSVFYPLDVQSWRCNEITARVPAGIPGGVYEMRVYGDAGRTEWENFRQVTVVNAAPTVEIVSPASGDRFSEGVSVTLEGSSFDRGVGSLLDSQVSWYLDGLFFRNGHSVSMPAGRLSPGSHQVRFDGTDGTSTVSTNVSIIIEAVVPDVNTPPSAQITSHSDPSLVLADVAEGSGWYKWVTLVGTGYDPEDGTLSGASLQWTLRDSNGNFLGSSAGNSWTLKFFGNCPASRYSIELTATDADGASGSDTITTFDVSQLC